MNHKDLEKEQNYLWIWVLGLSLLSIVFFLVLIIEEIELHNELETMPHWECRNETIKEVINKTEFPIIKEASINGHLLTIKLNEEYYKGDYKVNCGEVECFYEYEKEVCEIK